MFCSNCGRQSSEGQKFCPYCGTRLNVQSSDTQWDYTTHPHFVQQFAPMTCTFHPDEPAVNKCANCGTALCRQCSELSPYKVDDSQPLCLNCNRKLAIKTVDDSEQTITWSKVKLIANGASILLGIVVLLSGGPFFTAWIIAGLGGIPSTFKNFGHRTQEERIADEIHSRVDPEDGCMYWIMGIFVRIAIVLLLAPIAAIYFIIKNLLDLNEAKQDLACAQELLNQLNDIDN